MTNFTACSITKILKMPSLVWEKMFVKQWVLDLVYNSSLISLQVCKSEKNKLPPASFFFPGCFTFMMGLIEKKKSLREQCTRISCDMLKGKINVELPLCKPTVLVFYHIISHQLYFNNYYFIEVSSLFRIKEH